MKIINTTTTVFLVLVGLAFLKTGAEAIQDPQHVMDYVDVTLGNPSARNSIRAFYGFVNAVLGLFMVYGGFRMKREALLLALLVSGGFVLGRVYGLLLEGPASSFIYTWLTTEAIVAVASLSLLVALSRKAGPERMPLAARLA